MILTVSLFRVAFCRSRLSFVPFPFRADHLFILVSRAFRMFHLIVICFHRLLSIVFVSFHI